jgi:hypothetical protein
MKKLKVFLTNLELAKFNMYGINNSRFSAYIAFCKENRDEVKAVNPAAAFGDMGRLLRDRWNNMSESEKETYASMKNNSSDAGLRRSSRLRNKRLGVNFWGIKQN